MTERRDYRFWRTLVMAACFIASCSAAVTITMASAQEPLPPVTVADDGSAGGTVEVPLGRELEVALRANPTTGYTWRVSVDAAGPLRLKSKAFRRNPDAPAGNVGVGGIERFLFETTGTGSARLQFDYRRSAPGQSGKTYELMVTVVP